jgi:hypothetical protein
MSAAEISSGRDDIITLNIAEIFLVLLLILPHTLSHIYVLLGAYVKSSPNTYFWLLPGDV